MLKLGFDTRWVHLAMETITTASYLVLINGEHVVSFPRQEVLDNETHSLHICSCFMLKVGVSKQTRKSTNPLNLANSARKLADPTLVTSLRL